MCFQWLRAFALGSILALCLPILAQSPLQAQDFRQGRCHELLGALSDLKLEKESSSTQAGEAGYKERLLQLVNANPPEWINSIFKNYNSSFFGDLFWFARLKQSSTVSEALSRNPSIKQLVLDIHQFNRDFPNALWENEDTAQTIRNLLEAEEKAALQTRVKDVRADQLHQRITTLFTTVINRSLKEYSGEKLDRGVLQRLGDRVKRFIFPHYSRVHKLIVHGEVQQNQLGLIAAVDGIILNRGLNREAALKITQQEKSYLSPFVSDSPMQISKVKQELVRVYGQEAINGVPFREEDVNVYQLYGSIKSKDLSEVQANHQREAEQALDALDKVINEARKRLNLGARPLSDYVNDELQIRYDEKRRKTSEIYGAYQLETNKNSNVSYTVEDEHTRQVPDGTDKDGKTTYRTETYYLSRTVVPTYERILTNRFDRGDRFVSGLDSIIRATSDVRENEGVYRQILARTTETIEEIENEYSALKLDSGKRSLKSKEVGELITRLDKEIPALSAYANWSKNQVLSQWGRDSFENFKARNSQLLAALINIRLSAIFTKEILDRDLESISFGVGRTDLSAALKVLKWKMWINYAIKTTSGLAIAGTTTFAFADPEGAQQVMNWMSTQTHSFLDFVKPYVQ